MADFFLLFSGAKGEYSSHDNCNQAFSPVRLVDSLRKRRALARLLCIDVCWSERKRSSCAGQTLVGPKEGKESVLRDELSIGHSDALRSARRDSDHRQPDAYLRARTDETIIFRPYEFGGNGARFRVRRRDHFLFVFAFQLIKLRSLRPTVSIGCFSPSRSNLA